jgi:hypothetical protein
MFHAFSLVMQGCFSHPWLRKLLVACQMIVAYMGAAHKPAAYLRAAQLSLGIKRGHVSANATRCTSALACMQSVRENEQALRQVVANPESCVAKPAVVNLIKDEGATDDFWKVILSVL